MNGQLEKIMEIWLQSMQWFSKLYKQVSTSFNELLNLAEDFQLDGGVTSNWSKIDPLQKDINKLIKNLSMNINQHLESYSKWQTKNEFKLANGISVSLLKSANYPQAIRSIVEWSQKINDIGKQLFQYGNSCYEPKFLLNDSNTFEGSNNNELQADVLQQMREQPLYKTSFQSSYQQIIAYKMQNNVIGSDREQINHLPIIDHQNPLPFLRFVQQFTEEIRSIQQLTTINIRQQSDVNQSNKFLLRKKSKNTYRHQSLIMAFSQEGQQVQQKQLQQQQTSNRCSLHQLSLFYILGKNSSLRQYCNQCLNSQIQKNEVLCRKHGSVVAYLISQYDSLQKEEDQQIFLCQSCIISNKSTFFSICKDHYLPIQYVCLEQYCINTECMMLCSRCSHHKAHQHINFTKQSLMNKFEINKQIDINSYQQLYISAKQKLQMKLVNKIINSFLSKSEEIFCLFESYAVHSNTQIQQWTDFFMKHRDKHSLTVLSNVARLNHNKVGEQERIQYFEVVNDLFQKEITTFLDIIECQFIKLQKKMLEIANIEDELIDHHLNQKYQTIRNIQLRDFALIQPEYLNAINNKYCRRIKNLIISKQSEEQFEIELEASRKKLLSRFFNQQLKQKIYEHIQDNQQASRIYNQLLVADWLNRQILEDQYQQHNNLITQLTILYESLQSQHQAQLTNHMILNFFTKADFSNIKIVHISYALDKTENNYKYTISAFKVFEMIAHNQHLQKFAMKGVKVTGFNIFIKFFRLTHERASQQYFNLEDQQYGHIDMQDSKWTELKRQARLLNPMNRLQLSIDAEILWLTSNQLTYQIAKDLEYFCSFNILLSNLKFTFNLHKYSYVQLLKNILIIIKKIGSIKICFASHLVLKSIQNDVFYFLLESLNKFDNISEIEFKDIEFSPKLTKQQYEAFANALNIIFQNNKIRKLSLVNCRLFPPFPEISSLESIVQCKTTYLHEFIIRTQSLKSFKIVQENKKSKTTQYSNIHNLQALYIDDPSWLENQLQFPYLRHLTFNLHKNIAKSNKTKIFQKTKKIFKIVLPTLICLEEFHLQDTTVDMNILLEITSHELMDLYLSRCGTFEGRTLMQIDKKWAFLKRLTIIECGNSNILAGCRFYGLIRIKIDQQLVQENKREVRRLRRKGIEVIVN